MEWTTEFPNKPGYYWARNLEFKYSKKATKSVTMTDLQIVELNYFEIYFTGDEVGVSPDKFIAGEWFGPLEPPK
jgi:hypothetical protein